MALIKTEVVVGEAATQVLVIKEDVIFDPPLYKVIQEDLTVEIGDCLVCADKVLFNGKLIKDIIYKGVGCERGFIEREVRWVEVSVPFAGFVDVPGAQVGDGCQVEFAGVKDCNFLIPTETAQVEDRTGLIGVVRKALQKTIVDVTVKVVRTEQIEVAVSG
ncbi:MAG: DUF3794 domain-containing protein [Bacillota bacterium]